MRAQMNPKDTPYSTNPVSKTRHPINPTLYEVQCGDLKDILYHASRVSKIRHNYHRIQEQKQFFLHFLLHNRKKDYLCTRQEKTKYHQTLANEEINQKRIELNVIALAKLLGLGNLDTFMTLQAVSQCLRVSNTWALLKNCSVGSPRPPIQFEVSPRFLLRNN